MEIRNMYLTYSSRFYSTFKNYLIKIISQIIRVESLYSLPKKFLTYFTIYLLKLAINHSLPFPLIFK